MAKASTPGMKEKKQRSQQNDDMYENLPHSDLARKWKQMAMKIEANVWLKEAKRFFQTLKVVCGQEIN